MKLRREFLFLGAVCENGSVGRRALSEFCCIVFTAAYV